MFSFTINVELNFQNLLLYEGSNWYVEHHNTIKMWSNKERKSR